MVKVNRVSELHSNDGVIRAAKHISRSIYTRKATKHSSIRVFTKLR